MSDRKLSLRIAGNTDTPTLLAIRAKGYAITAWYTLDAAGDYHPGWDAEKEGRLFSATSPQELLGLIAMWEVRGDQWQTRREEPRLFRELTEAALVYDADGNVVDA